MNAQETMERHGLRFSMPQVFDHQVSGSAQECERMCYYRHGLGRVPNKEQFALTWGKVFHKVVELWTLHKDLDEVFAFINENLPEESMDRYGRNSGRMVELFTEWLRFCQQNPLEVLRTEQPTMVICNSPCVYNDGPEGCNLAYGGRLDRIVRWNGYVGPHDFKTTVMDETDPMSEYRPHHQMMGYLWISGHLIGHHPWGIIVEKVVCNKSKMKVNRFPVSYSKDLINEWVENEVILQARIRKLAAEHPYDESQWVQNHSRCYAPYPCQYRDICLSPRTGDFRYKIIRDQTKHAPWDFNNPDNEATDGTV